jgi:glycosyltransferase involved in cell wall biosynthesis
MSAAFGGVKEYVTSIVRELLKIDGKHRFSIYYADEKLVGTNPAANETYVMAPHKFAWDHWCLPRCLAKDKPDVVWFPHNVSSVGLKLPNVVSVMDMLYFQVPEFPQREYAWLDTLYMRTFIPRSVHKARRVMVISDWTKRDVHRILDVPCEKIQTIHLAPSSEFKPLDEKESVTVREKYGITRPFFFYAGVLSPRKNLRVLVEALGRVRDIIPHDLIITGGPGFIETPIDDIVTQYNLAGRIKRLGIVPKSNLVALYNAAEAFVFPSLYEGFGIPPLEAFACGCPVISSHATSLAEVVCGAALTFEPHDVDALAAHLKAVASDAGLRERLKCAGFDRVQQFSYVRAAKELLGLLEEAVS